MLDEALAFFSAGDIAGLATKVAEIAFKGLGDMGVAVAEAVDMMATGLSMIVDDIKDLGRLDRIHHWLWGVLLLVGGFISPAVIFLLSLTRWWSAAA